MEETQHRAMNPNIIQFFDRYAKGWDDRVCPEHKERLQGIIQSLSIPAGSRVLDVGSGNGVLIPFLSRAVGTSGAIVAIDLSHAMLAECPSRQRAPLSGLVQADVLDAPFPTEAFDWICCNSVFPHFVDQQGVLKSLARLLAPGAHLLICHSQSREAINAHHQKVGDIVGGHELPDKDSMHTMLRAAGFQVLHYQDTPTRYVVQAQRAPRE